MSAVDGINAGDYHLTAGSPAIDSANSGASNEPAADLDGNARVDDPATANTGAGSRTYDDRGAYEFTPPSNSAPVAVADDATSTPEGTAKVVAAPGVLGNDRDADGDPITAALVTNVSHGTLAWPPTAASPIPRRPATPAPTASPTRPTTGRPTRTP